MAIKEEAALQRTGWVPGQRWATFVGQPQIKIARMIVSAREGKFAILDFHYLSATLEGVEHFTWREP